ncbi:hypothetical protein RP20_CCG010725 [Aedes albopictus]|nr:hypothetical protein RP20_CCG010725 [Aedes albopictus]
MAAMRTFKTKKKNRTSSSSSRSSKRTYKCRKRFPSGGIGGRPHRCPTAANFNVARTRRQHPDGSATRHEVHRPPTALFPYARLRFQR